MAGWKPDPQIGHNEHIGRRLYDEPLLAGATDQKQFKGLDLRHFEERRDAECSVDRLGKSSIDRTVIGYLIPRANAAGLKFQKARAFNGWIWITAKKLMEPVGPSQLRLSVHASPIPGAEPDDNIYHAHVMRPLDFDYRRMALELRQIFLDKGRVEGVEQIQSRVPRFLPDLVRRPIIALLSRRRNKN